MLRAGTIKLQLKMSPLREDTAKGDYHRISNVVSCFRKFFFTEETDARMR